MIAVIGTQSTSTLSPYLDDSTASTVLPRRELMISNTHIDILESAEFVKQKKVKEFWKSPKGYGGQMRR